MAPPELIEDATTEILLRLPPDDPTSLVRASLVCESWRQLLSDPDFLRRYREFHGTPPLLGYLHNFYDDGPNARFVPATNASPFSTPALDFDGEGRWAVDCRHGRVLFYSFDPTGLIVWDPITDDEQHVPVPKHLNFYHTAAVLCGTDGCDHLDCHGCPFLVVIVGTEVDEDAGFKWASVYSSESGTWSSSISIQLDLYVEERPSLFTGDALYFTLDQGKGILKYDLIGRVLSTIDTPDVYGQEGIVVITEDGGLGFAAVKDDILYLWSWQVGPEGIAGWVQGRVIKIKTLLPILDPSSSLDLVGFAEGTCTIFISTDAGVFTFMLKSGQVRKVAQRGNYHAIIPYMSFYTPDL